MKRTRTRLIQKTFPLRKVIECNVTAMNKYLKPIVKYLPLYELLCLCHPADRYMYARRLERDGYLKHSTVRKFKTKEKFELA